MDPLAHVHIYRENWVSKVGQDFMDFQRLWETVMICSTSEAICQTVGSMMSQHGQNGSLKAENFSMEMMLQFNIQWRRRAFRLMVHRMFKTLQSL